MRNTNRALNRILLFVVGVVLLALGALLIAVVALPGVADVWSQTADGVRSWAEGIGQPSLGIGAVAALAVVVLVLILVAVGAVRGRHRVPLQSTGAESDAGRITITDGFASAALKNSLDERDEILVSRIASNEVRKETVLHVSVTPRQNTSPRQIAEYVDTLVANLATLTGQQFRTYISVHSSLRAKLAHDQKRLS
ncbi:hypothetical protein [Microbacterium sp. RURRCA19A]|uniref:hypothetical protein n=1 Tax=Microbacterium sp. RURRCA19A TaxID=1907391 RepID=UPI000954D3F1|nr:hypothetical protein [Microbacterium sp. RURRCA19A]SIR76635.1 hypothetical protein SAMN05880568_1368 [Microbacterium sp. RURRCA19A]